MKLYTYYAPVGTMPSPEQAALINCWRLAWQRAGWEPVVLTPKDAERHPYYKDYEDQFMQFPSVNAKNYEMACFLRWVAMAQIGGLMVDYDVLPFGFGTNDLPLNDGPLVSILVDNNPCPCAVNGTALQYENTVRMFSEYELDPVDIEPGMGPHISDQNIIAKKAALFRPFIFDVCHEVHSRDWKNTKLVHFPHGATRGKNRLALMKQAMVDRSVM